ncbi:MAG: prenyltransferase [Actinomycetota bacterium]|nr:prenyltransferase [Actinomycetota bacterium]
MSTTAATRMLDRLEGQYTHAVIAFLGDDGYPMSVATGFRPDPDRGVVLLDAVAGKAVSPPIGREVNVVFSHIRPQPGVGYDERRYVSLWGQLRPVDDGARLEFTPERVQHWDEQEVPFFEFSERGVPQAHRYMDQLSRETGRQVKPRLSPFWLFLRATRLPFLSATIVPIGLGIAVAALHGAWHWWLAVLTLVAGACVHLGLNVANDVFDTASGADAANVTPTQFSGGSRVIHYGLLTMRQMQLMSAAFYAVGLGIGLYLAVTRAFWPLLIIGAIGAFISYFYTAPPLRFVHRGLGEIAVFLGFGPIMVLGAYEVQARTFSWEALFASLPVGILIALVLYVNEVPDRPGDGAAGKRTLAVRLSKRAVIAGYVGSVAVAFLLVLSGALSGLLPRPTIIALAALPLAFPVYRGLRDHYESPYQLMPVMGRNIQLHLTTGMLLILGYVVALVAAHIATNPPVFLR